MKRKIGLVVAASVALAVLACSFGCAGGAAESHEHSWDEGVITQEATAEADGVKTYTCTICSKTKTEPVEYVAPAIELKEDTDFSALVSEQVTEDEWKAAFEIENVTIKLLYKDDEYYHIVQLNGSEYCLCYGEMIQYINKLDDGTLIVHVYDGTVIVSTGSFAPGDERYQDMLKAYNSMMNWNYPDFSNFYSSFTYDSANGVYVLNETVRTNSVFESGDCGYDFAVVKIINGKVAYIYHGSYGDEYGNEYSTEYFYDFGTTEITLPNT